MSTKASVNHGPGHHLYAEMFESGKVYLELVDVEFRASPRGVTVAIPADIWEQIRAHGIGEFRRHWFFGDERDEPSET